MSSRVISPLLDPFLSWRGAAHPLSVEVASGMRNYLSVLDMLA